MTNNKIVIPVPRSENYGEWTFKAILFLLWPFGAFLYSLRDAASKSSYVIYFLFGVLFCWHMAPVIPESKCDFMRIIERFAESHYTWTDIANQLYAHLTFTNGDSKELYENFLVCLTKSFTENYHLFFVFASIPYLFFMLKSLNQITSDKRFDKGLCCLMIIILFVLPRDILTVQNPRFVTGVWVALYATIKFFSKETYSLKYFALIAITPLIHSGFWFYLLVFVGGVFLRRFPSITIWLLYLSVPFSYMSYDILSGLDYSFMPKPIRVWTEGYLDETHFEVFVMNKGKSGLFWVEQAAGVVRNTVYLIIPLLVWRYRKESLEIKENEDLFQFYIYFYAIVNFIQFVPVLGQRFMWIVQIFSIYVYFKLVYPKHKLIIWLLLASWALFIMRRYFYGNSVLLSICPTDVFYMPLPTLIADFWGFV